MKVLITHNGIQSGQNLSFGYCECMIKSANDLAFLIPYITSYHILAASLTLMALF